MADKPLGLSKFIEAKFPWFKIDDRNHELLVKINQWCWRDKKFEIIPDKWKIVREENETVVHMQTKLFLDKGICLYGNVGSGKTDTLKIISEYLRYLSSPYAYNIDVVWRYADRFKKDPTCFDKIRSGNLLFDELCRTDETGYPTKEVTSNFGHKILVGEEIITIRELVFTNTGYITMFTTNETWRKLEEVYGARALSRLFKMCNMIPYIYPDRRFDSQPVIHNNMLKPTIMQPEQTSAFDEEQADHRIKEMLNKKYVAFRVSDSMKGVSVIDFNYFAMFGIECATEKQIQKTLIPKVIKEREKIIQGGRSKSAEEFRDFKKLLPMYETGTFDDTEKASIAAAAKRVAVFTFFQYMAKQGRELIFEEGKNFTFKDGKEIISENK